MLSAFLLTVIFTATDGEQGYTIEQETSSYSECIQLLQTAILDKPMIRKQIASSSCIKVKQQL